MLTDLLAIDGRMGRARYARLTLLALMLMCLGSILLVFPWMMSRTNGVEFVPVGLSAFIGLAQIALGLWIAVSSSIRRMQDMGWSALWLALCAVPIEMVAIPALVVLSLAMSFVKGVEGSNTHGPNPVVAAPD